jgi:hypothetical protein
MNENIFNHFHIKVKDVMSGMSGKTMPLKVLIGATKCAMIAHLVARYH